VDEPFTFARRFAIFVGSDRGITMSVVTRAAVVAALLLAAACSGEPKILEPGPTASSSSRNVEKPRVPKQAQQSTDEGAASFASYWIDTFNYAAKTGDTEELERLSTKCPPCRQFADSIAELESSKRPDGDLWKIQSTTVARDDVASDVKFDLLLPGTEKSTVAFELTPRAPYTVTDLYRVE
jgi:hypothetical protein